MSRLQCHRKITPSASRACWQLFVALGDLVAPKAFQKTLWVVEKTQQKWSVKTLWKCCFFGWVVGMKCILQFFLMTWSRHKSFVYRFVICVVLGTSHGVRAQRNDVLHTGPREAAKRHAGTNSGCPCWYCSSDITDTTNSPNKENRHEVRSLILTPFVSSSPLSQSNLSPSLRFQSVS